MIKIPLHLLSTEWVNFDGEEPAEFLDVTPTALLRLDHPVVYHLRASLVSGGILVEGTAATSMTAQCGRCLENFTAPLAAAEVCHFYENITEDELDVSADIREDLLILIPQNPQCQEDCRGLCPQCGVNLNRKKCRCKQPKAENDTWNALDGLKFEK